jgi:anti-anti-sigma regulatory factor
MTRRHDVLNSAAGLAPFGHVAWGYRDRAEFLSRAAEYIADGLRQNQYVAYSGEGTREALRSELAEMPGISDHIDSGGMEVTPAEDHYVYLPGTDVIDADEAMAKYLAAVEQAIAKGYSGFRAVSDLTSVARTPLQRDALARLEYRVDQQMAVLPFSAFCGYDISELRGTAEELICLHPFVSEGSVTFRLYADPDVDVDFAISGEIDAAASKLFDTTLERVWPLESNHTLHIGAQELQFISHGPIFNLEERAREQDRKVVLSTNQPAISRLVDVFDLIHVRVTPRWNSVPASVAAHSAADQQQ